MAAVVDRVDGCVGSLVSDAVSLIQSIPLPDQNNPLLGLPIVAIETILSFLSYDEISLLRSVRTKTSPLDRKTLILDVFQALLFSESCTLCVLAVNMILFISQVQMCSVKSQSSPQSWCLPISSSACAKFYPQTQSTSVANGAKYGEIMSFHRHSAVQTLSATVVWKCI